MISTALFLLLLARPGLEVATRSLSLPGQPLGLHALDVNGDGVLDGLVTLRSNTGRSALIIDGAGSFERLTGFARPVQVPDDTIGLAACPGIASGLLLLRRKGVDLRGFDGTQRWLVHFDRFLPLVERRDLPVLNLCPSGAWPLVVPAIDGLLVQDRADSALRRLRVSTRVHLASGMDFRGPRARRDFSLMAMLLWPRVFWGDVSGDGKPELTASIEDDVYVETAAGLEHRRLPLRSVVDRSLDRGLVDARLVDLDGDGVLDVLASFQRGGSNTLRTTWQVLRGPLIGARPGSSLAAVERKGLATPLLVADIDLDGRLDIVEPHVDTGILAMGKALVTGHLPVRYRRHRIVGGRLQSGQAWIIEHDIDWSRSTNLSGHAPLLGADIDGDGRGDLLALGAADRIDLFLGLGGDPPFGDDAVLEVNVPSTETAVLLRQGQRGAPVVLLLSRADGRARLTAVVFAASER